MPIGSDRVETLFVFEDQGAANVENAFERVTGSSASLTTGLGTLALAANQTIEVLQKAVQLGQQAIEFGKLGASAADTGAAFERLGGTAADMERLRKSTLGIIDDTTLQKIENLGVQFGLNRTTIEQLTSASVAFSQTTDDMGNAASNALDVIKGFGKGEAGAFERLGITMQEVEDTALRLNPALATMSKESQLAAKQAAALDVVLSKGLKPDADGLTVAFGAAQTQMDNFVSDLQVFTAETIVSSGVLDQMRGVMDQAKGAFEENKEAISKFLTEGVDVMIESLPTIVDSLQLMLDVMIIIEPVVWLLKNSMDALILPFKVILDGVMWVADKAAPVVTFIEDLGAAAGDGATGLADFAAGIDAVRIAQERFIEKIQGLGASKLFGDDEEAPTKVWTAKEMSSGEDALLAMQDDLAAAAGEKAKKGGKGGGGIDDPTPFMTMLGLSSDGLAQAAEALPQWTDAFVGVFTREAAKTVTELSDSRSFIANIQSELVQAQFDQMDEFNERLIEQRDLEQQLHDEQIQRFEDTADMAAQTASAIHGMSDSLAGEDGAAGALAGFSIIAADATALVTDQMAQLAAGTTSAGQAIGASMTGALGVVGAVSEKMGVSSKALMYIKGFEAAAHSLMDAARFASSWGTDVGALAGSIAYATASASYFIGAGKGGGSSAGSSASAAAASAQRPSFKASESSGRDPKGMAGPSFNAELAPIVITNQIVYSASQALDSFNALARQRRGVQLDSDLVSKNPMNSGI